MAEQENHNEGFWKRIITSIKDFDKYIDFAVEKFGTAFKYFIKLMLLFCIVVTIAFTYKFAVTVNNGFEYFKTEIPNLSYSDGILTVESTEPVVLDNKEEIIQYVVIDVNAEEQTKSDYISKLRNYDNAILFLQDRVYVKNSMLSDPMEYVYKDLANQYGIQDFTKEQAIDYIDSLDKTAIYLTVFITMGIYVFIIYFISVFIDVIMLAVLGFLVSRIVGIKIKFQPILNMAIYAITLPVILNMLYIVLNTCTGLTIKYFQWMYSTISYIYMIIAILMIKADLINKQKELMKIVEEQEKVRKEIEERKLKEEEKRQKEKEKEEKKEEKKEKKKEDKDNNIGEEPEGSKA